MRNDDRTLIQSSFWGNDTVAGTFISGEEHEGMVCRALIFSVDALVNSADIQNPVNVRRLANLEVMNSGYVEIGHWNLSADGAVFRVFVTDLRNSANGHRVAQFWSGGKLPGCFKLHFKLIVWGEENLINQITLNPGELVTLELEGMSLRGSMFQGKLIDIRRADAASTSSILDPDLDALLDMLFAQHNKVDGVKRDELFGLDDDTQVDGPVFEADEVGAMVAEEINGDRTLEYETPVPGILFPVTEGHATEMN